MTCIAAVTDGRHAWIGCDSGTANDGDMGLDLLAVPKLARWDWPGLPPLGVGVAGRLRMLNLVHRWDPPPPPPGAGPDDSYPYVLQLAEALGEYVEEAGGISDLDPHEGDGVTGSRLLTVWAGRLYVIGQDLHVLPVVTDYFAIGSGAPLATGALAAIGDGVAPQRIRHALEIAAAHTTDVCQPFTIEEVDGDPSPVRAVAPGEAPPTSGALLHRVWRRRPRQLQAG